MSNILSDGTGAVELNGPNEQSLAELAAMSVVNDRTIVNTPVSAPRASAPAVAKCLGRYELIKKLGEGGMGAVYQARDTATGVEVAVKVLAAGFLSQTDAMRRFEKEARLLEAAKSPHVANLLDVGIEGETRYLVMEFVSGGDLRQWLKKQRTLDEASSLEIIGDLCRALVNAHAQGMVHRDIKPENVLLDDSTDQVRPLVKLTDFGLARHVDQSESLKLTQTGALLGTPYYMSPEQFTGAHEISPATDVYSLGATFFELLTGMRPFNMTDAIQLASAHCFEEAPDVRKLNTTVSDATADLIRRMLAKHPGQRPQDASSLLEEILRLQTGDSSQFVVHPLLPDHDPAGIVSVVFEWTMESTAAALWPYVSNTDRFNHATGLQPVTYETFTETDGRIRKFGQFKLAGMNVRWEEHPFEWIEGQRFSILREFPTGPFVWFMSDVELCPRPDGSTQLIHRVKIQPRGMVGRMLAKLQLGASCRRRLETIYRRIDRTVFRKNSAIRISDPYRAVRGIKTTQRVRLDQRLEQLAAVNTTSEIVEALRELILNSSDQDLARLRPYTVANVFNLPEQEVVEAFLKAATVGLMTIHWDIICPTCRLASDTRSTLREIEQHGNCSACQTNFNVDFGTSLELIFRVHPEIRAVDARTYCAGGPGNFPHVVAQIRLKPGERLQVPLSLDSGRYVARGPCLPYAIPIDVTQQSGLRHGQVKCVPGLNRSPIASLKSGHQNLALENFFPCEQLIRIERTLRRSEALTAAKVATLPLFQTLFPEQTLKPGMLVEVATSNFLGIQLDGFDEAFNALGDAETYSLVNDCWRIVEHQIVQQGGTIVERSAGMRMFTFWDSVNAIETAQSLAKRLVEERSDWPWTIAAAVHRGAALVTSDRHEVNYFGATVNLTRRLAQDAGSNQLLLTNEISSDPAVQSKFANLMKPSNLRRPNENSSIQMIILR